LEGLKIHFFPILPEKGVLTNTLLQCKINLVKMDMEYGFGTHLMLDCYDCPKDKLEDTGHVFNILDSLPDKIKMTKVMSPQVFKYRGKVSEDWGLSGVVLIAESHISIHTFPDEQYAFIDIFSCKEFDIDHAREELLKLFKAKRHEIRINNLCSSQIPTTASLSL
jgi:S-adenosylmethionine decarboxylase